MMRLEAVVVPLELNCNQFQVFHHPNQDAKPRPCNCAREPVESTDSSCIESTLFLVATSNVSEYCFLIYILLESYCIVHELTEPHAQSSNQGPSCVKVNS